MNDKDIILSLQDHEVTSLLSGRELEVLRVVEEAYEAHARGETVVPRSAFLNIPRVPLGRFVTALGYIGGNVGFAGAKLISSFPANRESNLPVVSGILVLCSPQTGQLKAILEASAISLQRTAASAALAAKFLVQGKPVTMIGVIGAGLVNFEIIRFLRKVFAALQTVVAFDLDMERLREFAHNCRYAFPELEVEVASGIDALLCEASLISVATTATRPHINNLPCAPGKHYTTCFSARLFSGGCFAERSGCR